MKRILKLAAGALLLAGIVAAAGCQDKNPTASSSLAAVVITGSVTDSAQNLKGASVQAQTDSGWTSAVTDANGQYTLEIASLPESLTVCVSAVNYTERCTTFTAFADTLHADFMLTREPPSDSIFLSTDTVFAGDTAEIYVNIGNPDSAIAGMNLWLKPEITTITYDTVMPVSPRFPISGMEWSAYYHIDENIVALLFVDLQNVVYIPPGSGPVLKYLFVVDPSTPAGTYAINSEATAGVPRPYDLSYRSGLSMPAVLFIPGTIVVQ